MQNRREEFMRDMLPDVPEEAASKASRYSPQEVAKALYDSHGMTGKACKTLDVSASTLRKYMNDYPEVMQAYIQGKADFDDVAEEKLFELVEQGNSNVVMFYNRTKNASRGYHEKLAVDLIPYELQQRLQAVCERNGLSIEAVTQQLIDTLDRVEVVNGQATITRTSPKEMQPSSGDPLPPVRDTGD